MFIDFITRLARNRKGGTAIEYGLILALVIITMIAALAGTANQTISMWGNVNTKVQQANSG